MPFTASPHDDDLAEHRIYRAAVLFSEITGESPCRHTMVAPYWQNEMYPDEGYAFTYSKPHRDTETLMLVFAPNNSKGAVPLTNWTLMHIKRVQRFVYYATGLILAERAVGEIKHSLVFTDSVLDVMEAKDIKWLRQLWHGLIQLELSEQPISPLAAMVNPSSTILHITPPATTAVPTEMLARLRLAIDDVTKGRSRKPGPMAYAEAWSIVHQAALALLESVGL